MFDPARSVPLPAAREIIEAWRTDYNEVRPHKSLGKKTPEEFEKVLTPDT